jgi:peptide deformylase
MSTLEIITPQNPVLRHRAAPVTVFNDELQQLIDNMIVTMREANGVGLAAPQVAESRRLAVIETPPEIDDEGQELPDTRELHVIINPEITWRSSKMDDGIEGCLSIPGYLGEVARPEAIRVKALDRDGKKVNLRLKGWTARIFQHEIDHLDGVLYIDRLTAPENFWREEDYYAMLEADDEADPEEIHAA